MEKIVYSLWFGHSAMSPQRESALLSIFRVNNCANVHINTETFNSWIHPDLPLHPSFYYLSATHQSDYMRSYLMHVYGGGYTDIKNTVKNWRPYFDLLNSPNILGVGYTEIGPHGIAPVGGALELEMKKNYQNIIGFCAMIFKPQTAFTAEWHLSLNKILTEKYGLLKQNPARHPQDQLGAQFTDGTISAYPLKWTEIGGDIFHPLVYKYQAQILHADIAPSFVNYR